MPKNSPEKQFTFVFPKELLEHLKNPNWCLGYTPRSDIPFEPQVGGDYNPILAEWSINAIIYAYRQYCDPKNFANSYPPDVESATKLYWHEDLNFFDETIPTGYIGKIKDIKGDSTNRIVIAFRGTERTSEWLENIDFGQEAVTFPNTNESVGVHKGFWSAYTKPRYHSLAEAIKNTTYDGFWSKIKQVIHYKKPSLQEQLNVLIPKYIKKGVKNELYIAGHSLGAAIAMLVNLDSILQYQNVGPDKPTLSKVVCYIIGTPRVGSDSLSALLEDLSNNPKYTFTLWRLVNTEDVVPTAPPPVADKLIYTQFFLSGPDAPNRVGSVNFSDNLGKIEFNHHPSVYLYANEQLMPDKKSSEAIKGIDQKAGDDKKSS